MTEQKLTEDEREMLALILRYSEMVKYHNYPLARSTEVAILTHYRKAKELSWKEGWEDNERNQKG